MKRRFSKAFENGSRFETPSPDGEAVNRLVDLVEADAAALGGRIERTPGRDGFGDILTVRSPWGGDQPGILILSHLDTVHPIGTLADHNTFRREGDRVYGPGIFDMKSGAYLAFYAFQHLIRTGQETPLPLTFLYVPEEEIGSPTSRQRIEDEARRNKYVLVTEPAHGGLCLHGSERCSSCGNQSPRPPCSCGLTTSRWPQRAPRIGASDRSPRESYRL